MTVIAVFNQKGGVGKTTTALNLAGALHQQQHEVALIDLDPQAHLTEIHKPLGLNPQQQLFQFYQSETALSQLMQVVKPGMHLLAANAELAKVDSHFGRGPNILRKLRTGLDTLSMQMPGTHVVLDCCPFIGVISLNAIFACDLMVVPVASDFFSINSAIKVDKALNALAPVLKRRVDRRYLLTRVDRRKKMTAAVEQEMRQLFGDHVLTTRISENIALAESPRVGKNVFDYAASSIGARDYIALYDELRDILKHSPQPLD